MQKLKKYLKTIHSQRNQICRNCHRLRNDFSYQINSNFIMFFIT
ncbi:hypothetical protein LEP1GSC107_4401 [Leptospira interrogans serovar Grippotyphosa str. UI 12769]|uniref:Uncharacterized protein n=2 Tax=Leptospira interrogans TaxID=173 RepID=A0A0F6H532_LEPIR|nr:hypothetical protein G436_4152 [Leptospira interrogans serovar Hardjo str. Norma]EKO23323.1 hypothetical protein LEP1GSC104_0198 [Leptospira interrogans str. UI 12621]EMN86674.1 hypothetical protein LEP1GSC107_4401 [Leptospira interrogans serovar Grippotyphosa str. UI 12769]